MLIVGFCSVTFAQEKYLTLFEKTGGEESDNYFDIISFCRTLANDFPQVQMKEMGLTDSGYPLHLLIYDSGMTFEPDSWRADGKTIMFSNNCIHPCENSGMEAVLLYLRDTLLGKAEIPDDVILAVIPVYNIGGFLNRVRSYLGKAGPLEYGTRYNARNYDLNRDFMKADTSNAQSIQEIFNWLKPHIFIDTHEDAFQGYQTAIGSIISNSGNKLGGQVGEYLFEEMWAAIPEKMEEKGVNPSKPSHSDSPRMGNGFATLFNAIGFMPEWNRLKPYTERVSAYYALFETFMEILEKDGGRIVRMVEEDRESMKTKDSFGINYTVTDKEKYKLYTYSGYEKFEEEKISPVTGQPIGEICPVLRTAKPYYNLDKPIIEERKWYYHKDPQMYIERPQAYVIPQVWLNVVHHLERNGVVVEKIEEDTTLEVSVYHIGEFKRGPYGKFVAHRLLSNVELEKSTEQVTFKKGDYLVPMNQESNRFIVETLEPQARDSLFAWNWFDKILSGPWFDTIQPRGLDSQQFEATAAEYLKENPDLKEELEALKKVDEDFAQDKFAQLYWVYERSPLYPEEGANNYPIYRVER